MFVIVRLLEHEQNYLPCLWWEVICSCPLSMENVKEKFPLGGQFENVSVSVSPSTVVVETDNQNVMKTSRLHLFLMSFKRVPKLERNVLVLSDSTHCTVRTVSPFKIIT